MPKWNIKIIDAHARSARVLRQWCKNNETFRGHYFCTMQVQLPMLTKNCQANPIYVHRVELLLCDSSLLLFSSEYLFESLPNAFQLWTDTKRASSPCISTPMDKKLCTRRKRRWRWWAARLCYIPFVLSATAIYELVVLRRNPIIFWLK